ncbi:hypothetical protein BpHYR1_047663 [Brachionus plicatilis]|uniref:Uncharacterized protein n=1 Tax=Brachionus plicatilis TaxID=10195 RepID=A0A3M7S1I5_BRAPC|nr:hypothetical protein BpHYR1_047663 [Brachionus plicatilis]
MNNNYDFYEFEELEDYMSPNDEEESQDEVVNNKKTKKKKKYVFVEKFNNAKDATKCLESEKVWSFRNEHENDNGLLVSYRCNMLCCTIVLLVLAEATNFVESSFHTDNFTYLNDHVNKDHLVFKPTLGLNYDKTTKSITNNKENAPKEASKSNRKFLGTESSFLWYKTLTFMYSVFMLSVNSNYHVRRKFYPSTN